MNRPTCYLTALLGISFGSALPAQITGPQEQAASSKNHFGVGASMIWGLEARFANTTPVFSGANVGPATGGRTDRFYDDGFVRVDSSGNAGGTTWFWEYQNAAQINPVADTVSFHAVAGASQARSSAELDNPQVGLEVFYRRDLWEWKRFKLSALAAFNHWSIGIESRESINEWVGAITDQYPLNGVLPPGAPYTGSYSGPGALIGDSPVRTVGALNAQTSGRRKLDASLSAFKLGPSFALRATRWLSFQGAGGLACGYLQSDFDFSETTTRAGTSLDTRTGRASTDDWLVGGFVGGSAQFFLSEHWNLFAGAQFLSLGKQTQSVNGKQAELDLSSTWVFSLGAGISF